MTNYQNGVSSYGIPVLGYGVPPSDTPAVIVGTNNENGQQPDFMTIGDALSFISTQPSTKNFTILIQPGNYDELVVVPHSIGQLTIVGMGELGGVSIAPSGAGVPFTWNNKGMTCINIDFAAQSASTFACLGTAEARFYGCKFEGADTSGSTFGFGPGSVADIAAGLAGKGGDCKLVNCEFAWGFDGISGIASDFGQATEVVVENCWFHDLSDTHIISVPGAFGIGAFGGLQVNNCVFSNDEAGTAPADFIAVNDASDTGIFTNNSFALATNASADLKIGAKVLWVANKTEAGVSAARPA